MPGAHPRPACPGTAHLPKLVGDGSGSSCRAIPPTEPLPTEAHTASACLHRDPRPFPRRPQPLCHPGEPGGGATAKAATTSLRGCVRPCKRLRPYTRRRQPGRRSTSRPFGPSHARKRRPRSQRHTHATRPAQPRLGNEPLCAPMRSRHGRGGLAVKRTRGGARRAHRSRRASGTSRQTRRRRRARPRR